jgi:hypothetical protein
MLAIQVIVVGFALFALVLLVSRFRKRGLGGLEFFVWFTFWIAVGVVGVDPDITYRFAGLIGVGRGVDAVIYVTLLMLCYLAFRQRITARHHEQQITALVRKLALEEAERKR